jgi:hypothetical protein
LLRILLAVVLFDRGRVLIPIWIGRIVLIEHELQAIFIEAEHITYVAGVFERRPDIGLRPLAETTLVTVVELLPRLGVFPDQRGELRASDHAGLEPAFGTRAL